MGKGTAAPLPRGIRISVSYRTCLVPGSRTASMTCTESTSTSTSTVSSAPTPASSSASSAFNDPRSRPRAPVPLPPPASQDLCRLLPRETILGPAPWSPCEPRPPFPSPSSSCCRLTGRVWSLPRSDAWSALHAADAPRQHHARTHITYCIHFPKPRRERRSCVDMRSVSFVFPNVMCAQKGRASADSPASIHAEHKAV